MDKKCKYSCEDCMEYKKGDCGGLGKPETCEDFKYSPHMSEVDKECWPKFFGGSYGYKMYL